MPKHAADRRRRRQRVDAAGATIGAVVALGLVIAVLAGVRAADGDPADVVVQDAANAVADPVVKAGSPSSASPDAPAASSDAPQTVVPAETVKLDKVKIKRQRLRAERQVV